MRGMFRVYFVSETAQVELKSGRVKAPAQRATHGQVLCHGTRQAHGVAAHVDFETKS